MTVELITRDIFLRHTDGNGSSYVMCHRVWDAELFVRRQQEAAEKVAKKALAEDKPFMHKVEQVTEEQFKQERCK